MYMTTSEIRKAFLEYFHSHGHEVVSSSSLVPHNDPTLLFTNAGMNQFKDVFLGKELRSYSRATTAQRCVRAGGKHNDLDNVGYTARHHTFFEMLGNFSFGDYFKKDAIHFAWGFLTGVLKLPAEKLTVTVYQSDDEAYDIWNKEIGVPAERIVRIGDNKGAPYASDNFWQMGDTGPCGPCSEIFYDHGADIWGGPPGSAEEDGDRFIEVWNIVFMQYNRTIDGEFHKLPRPSVDTGMGLERIAAVMQGVHSNYEIDLFKDLISKTAAVLSVTDLTNKSLRVIADHIRSCSFLIADGVLPSNEGRGYVLRRIIRRAVRHGRLLGAKDVFFYKLVAALADLMGDAYPELRTHKDLIEKTLKKEEEQFIRTLDRGLTLLNEQLEALGDSKTIPGDVVFKLYDTYGFPVDLTADVVRDAGYVIDLDGFNKEMDKQRARAKEASAFEVDYNSQLKIQSSTEFVGYSKLTEETEIEAIFKGVENTDALSTDEQGVIVLKSSPFYAECGGQAGDIGVIKADDNFVFRVSDTKKAGNAIIHIGKVELGSFVPGMKVVAEVDRDNRKLTCAHHSATHLLQAALRQVVGTHVNQKGSSVNAERLRFDFSNNEPLTEQQIAEVELLVNRAIANNLDVITNIMDLEEAKKTGAMALFGEKYEQQVRVVSMGDFSCELCGGTHVSRTGDIGFFKILSDSGIAAGVRRIEAVTNLAALSYVQKLTSELRNSAELLKSEVFAVSDKVKAALDHTRELEHENSALKEKLALSAVSGLMNSVTEINGVKTLIATFDGVEVKEMRTSLDDLKNRLKSAVIVLASVVDGRVFLISGVTKDLTSKVKAGDLVNHVASQIDGKGGGRPDMAQGGGTNVANLPKAMESVALWLEERLG
ncbi:MAG: alanine--tRNA ligase [Ruminobacter sp.]|jgi:alanyl-tRNA synthetase|uniref:Alanine--tRNA ligase n=2 Tax=Ruminobacter TaxID=866 RepID=A0A662ZIV9_9GAMM|nr:MULTISPECIES: alanine--tRNA ligase [Ruminobacter]MBQ3775232.1 alanine--tRNA ligase [Ruminobacter sp.]SFP55242.1 alanyl-tRNA synthetase [Ruminobacter amylophilus]